MASSNDEEGNEKLLMDQNTELVTKVQFWKMKAAQLETEKLDLIKENNNLRLRISRLRHLGATHARALDLAHQAASEEALTHIVKASSALTRTMELTKKYMRQREELEATSPRWSNLSSSPDNSKVHKVPPLLMGGKTIQPFVSLSRVPLTDNSYTTERSANLSRNSNERVLPLPMRDLQDAYISLRRLDAADLLNHNAAEPTEQAVDAENNLSVEDEAASNNELDGSQNMSTGDDLSASNRPLSVVQEDAEDSEDDDAGDGPSSDAADNPLEGPSWLLDRPRSRKGRSKSCLTLEADSTTEPDESRTYTPSPILPATIPTQGTLDVGVPESRVFTPTIRRRKRISSPPALPSPTLSAHMSPRLPVHVHKNSAKSRICGGRVLKVIVPKMRLDVGGGGDSPPPKRLASFDAPSPNGATDAAVIVMEENPDRPEDDAETEPPPNQSLAKVNTNARTNTAANANSDREDNRSETNVAASRTKGSNARANSHSNNDSRNSSILQAGPSWLTAEGDSRTVSDANVSGARGSEANVTARSRVRGSAANVSRTTEGRGSRDSSQEGETSGRTRRPKKQVTYKEKPLNRKMRR